MALPVFFDCEGGSNGATWTTADTGSGTTPDATATGGTSTITYTNASPMHGKLCMAFQNDASGSACNFKWSATTLTGTITEIWTRCYFNVSTFTGGDNITIIRNGATAAQTLNYNASGKITNKIGAGTQTAGTATLSINTWYRLETRTKFVNNTADNAEWYLYLGDNTNLLDSAVSTGNIAVTTLNLVEFGNNGGGGTSVLLKFDDMAAAATKIGQSQNPIRHPPIVGNAAINRAGRW